MYGNEANPGVRFRYRRLRCGDWWDEDPSSPTYNSFQHVACGTEPPFAGNSEGMWQQRPYPTSPSSSTTCAPSFPARAWDLPARADRRADDRLHLAAQDQLRAVRWLRPADAPMIAIGTRAGSRLNVQSGGRHAALPRGCARYSRRPDHLVADRLGRAPRLAPPYVSWESC